jgi:DNA-binding winged helix-turn-helix (wHTH) protein
MTTKCLYNLEDQTLIILNPKGMILDVKKDTHLVYKLSKKDFAIIYLLTISHPDIVRLKEFNLVLGEIGIEFKNHTVLQNDIKRIKKELQSFGINKFIIKIKRVGYAISNIWVEPSSMRPSLSNTMKMKKFLKATFGII